MLMFREVKGKKGKARKEGRGGRKEGRISNLYHSSANLICITWTFTNFRNRDLKINFSLSLKADSTLDML